MGLNDYIKNGIVEQGRQARMVLVNSENDLEALGPYGYEPGTLAYTAGFAQMWQLSASGEWVSVFGQQPSGSTPIVGTAVVGQATI